MLLFFFFFFVKPEYSLGESAGFRGHWFYIWTFGLIVFKQQGEIHMTEEAIQEILEQTESDPAFQGLFDMFDFGMILHALFVYQK